MLGGFNLNVSGNLLLFFITATVLLVFSLFLYRSTNPPVSTTMRRILASLRIVSLLLILSILLEPLLTLKIKKNEKPVIAVLVDNSASMSLTDAKIVRPNELALVLEESIFKNKSINLAHNYFTFSNGIRDFNPAHIDSLTFTQEGTDISSSLQLLKNRLENKNLCGVILISDGNYNIGENPARFARDFGTPIFPISIGDPSEQKDILITKINTNRITYVDNKVPVDITVRANGFRGKDVIIELKKDGRLIDSKAIQLSEQEFESRIRLYYTPEKPGQHKYSVQLSKFKGELTLKNNKKNFFVKILKSKFKLLLIAGSPGLDFSFISRTLKQDPNIELTSRVLKNNSLFYEGNFPSVVEELNQYDCFVLLDFPRKNSSPKIINALASALNESHKSVFLIGGKDTFYPGLKPIQNILPMAAEISAGKEYSTYFKLTGDGLTHPVMRLSENEIENQSIWKSLPPIYYSAKRVQQLPGSRSLLEVDKQISKIFSNEKSLPVVLSKKTEYHKAIAILSYGIWRWDFLMQGIGHYNETYNQIIGNCIRWLTTREDSKKVRVYPDKNLYRSGEKISIIAEIYYEDFSPLNGAEIKVNIRSNAMENEIVLSGTGEGTYEGEFHVLKAGDYTYRGTAYLQDRLLGEDRGRFAVEEFSLEFQDTKMNEALLKQIAENSGGQYYTSQSMSNLESKLNFPMKETYEHHQWELWNRVALLIAIILLLSIEWYLRKKKGML